MILADGREYSTPEKMSTKMDIYNMCVQIRNILEARQVKGKLHLEFGACLDAVEPLLLNLDRQVQAEGSNQKAELLATLAHLETVDEELQAACKELHKAAKESYWLEDSIQWASHLLKLPQRPTSLSRWDVRLDRRAMWVQRTALTHNHAHNAYQNLLTFWLPKWKEAVQLLRKPRLTPAQKVRALENVRTFAFCVAELPVDMQRKLQEWTAILGDWQRMLVEVKKQQGQVQEYIAAVQHPDLVQKLKELKEAQRKVQALVDAQESRDYADCDKARTPVYYGP